MRTIIVGCGRVGSNLARLLSEEGDEVAVVDSSEAAFNRLGEDFTGEMVFGSAVDEDILRRAGTDRAQAFVAVTNADTTNIMAAQLAQHEFGVKKVICRIYDPARADVYRELGLKTICPTTMGAQKIERFFEEK
jgi:trk system potassium uptake protein